MLPQMKIKDGICRIVRILNTFSLIVKDRSWKRTKKNSLNTTYYCSQSGIVSIVSGAHTVDTVSVSWCVAHAPWTQILVSAESSSSRTEVLLTDNSMMVRQWLWAHTSHM